MMGINAGLFNSTPEHCPKLLPCSHTVCLLVGYHHHCHYHQSSSLSQSSVIIIVTIINHHSPVRSSLLIHWPGLVRSKPPFHFHSAQHHSNSGQLRTTCTTHTTHATKKHTQQTNEQTIHLKFQDKHDVIYRKIYDAHDGAPPCPWTC